MRSSSLLGRFLFLPKNWYNSVMNNLEKITPRLLKGFKDYSQSEQVARQKLFNSIQQVFESFGFWPLATPTLEFAEILLGKYGDGEKLVYEFEDNGGRAVAMRYDLTVPLARFVALNKNQLSLPFKRYQIAPVWRADNPQKGRLREFYQADIDVVGVDSFLADAEVILCVCSALESIGVMNYKVRLNDRAVFAGLSDISIRIIDKLDKIGLSGVEAELREAGVSDVEIRLTQELLAGAGKASAEESVVMPERVQQILKVLHKEKEAGRLSGKIIFDPSIARGLEYYTGMVFEVVLEDKPEFGSIAGGGRYNNLLDTFGNDSLPAVGGSIGVDRLFQAIYNADTDATSSLVKAIILNQTPTLQVEYFELASELRGKGIAVELYYFSDKLEKQFKYAEAQKIPFAIIIGEQEMASQQAQLKDLVSREQKTVAITELAKFLQ